MKKFLFYIFLCLGLSTQLFAQDDTLSITPQIVLNDGVYLSYKDLQTNSPLLKENISSDADKTQSDFISKTLSNYKEIIFKYKGSQYRADVDKVWGYCQNGTLYINFKGQFCRVTLFGNISHFFATFVVTRYVSNYGGYGGGFYGGMGGMGMGPSMPVKQNETHEFALDFKTGEIEECTPTYLETIFSRDIKLYAQYMDLRRKKRKELMMLFIRRYNINHPVVFLTAPNGQ
ncbi:MAG: hypothetical protein ABI448_16085 [Bacteroidia bacterium]